MSPTAIIVLVIVVVVVIAASILVGQRGLTLEDATNRRLIEYAQREEEVTIADAELDVPFYERVVVPLLNAISKRIMQLTPEAQLESIRSKLDAAGMLQKTSPGAFLGKRLMYTVVLGLAGLAVLFVVPNLSTLYKLLIVILLPVAGYYLPMSQVNSQIKRRQQSIVRDLPDALDLMTICVEAGLTFDAAMTKVYEKWDNEIAAAFGRVLGEIQLGKPRREGLRDLAKRMQVPDLTSFLAAIIQADQLGVSIARILRIQSDQMRVKRRQRAQEKAQQAPIKMLFPMVFMIFPSMFLVLLGPAALLITASHIF